MGCKYLATNFWLFSGSVFGTVEMDINDEGTVFLAFTIKDRSAGTTIGKINEDGVINAVINPPADLLEKTQLNVSEVAFNVGFSSATYFSKVFKEEFGYAPKEAR